MSEINHPKYRPDIDGLRAIAILLVVGFHAFPSTITGGYIGVDIFFVISGYLISSILFQSLNNNQFSILDFYSRRIRRIFPALIMVLVSCLFFGWYALTPYEFSQLGKNTGAGTAFISNFVFWREVGYFDIDSQKKILLHLWSLAIEEQFYIVWPMLLWMCHRFKWNFLAVTLLALFSSFILNVISISHDRVSVFYHPGTRFWELLIGAMLAYVSLEYRELFARLPKKFPDLSSILGLILVALGVILLKEDSEFPGWWALLPTLGAVLILASGDNSFVNRKLLKSRILIYIGLISYPLYLWHWPLLSFLRIIEGSEVPAMLRAIAIGIAFIFSVLTYFLVEGPIRRRKNSRPLVIVFLLTAMCLVGFLGLFVYKEQGFPERNSVAESFRKNNWSYGWRNHGCQPEFLKVSSDCIANSSAAPEIVIIGDSHTQGLFLHLAKLLPKQSIMRFGVYLPLFDVTVVLEPGDIPMRDRASDVLLFAIKEESVGAIIIGFRGVMNLMGTDFKNGSQTEKRERVLRGNNDLNKFDSEEVLKVSMDRTMRRLSQSNKKVIFILDNPELGFNPEECLEIRPLHFTKFSTKKPCAVPRAHYELRNKEYRELVFSILKRYPKITPLDMQEKFCDSLWCYATKNDMVLYMDGNHLSNDGSNFLAKELIKLIN